MRQDCLLDKNTCSKVELVILQVNDISDLNDVTMWSMQYIQISPQKSYSSLSNTKMFWLYALDTNFSFLYPVASKVCPPCDNELKADTIMEHYCASDFGKILTFIETLYLTTSITYL